MKPLSIAWCLFFVLSTQGCAQRKGTEFATGMPVVKATAEEAGVEQRMFQRLNQDRHQRGLPPLVFDDRLADIARYHSRDMRDQGFFGHDSPTTGSAQNRIDKAGYLAMETRENVALAPDVDTAQDQLLASPGHFANIVATTVTHVGIGAVRDNPVPGQVQGYFFTQLFAKPVTVMSLAQAREVVLEKVAQARKKAGLPNLQLHPVLERLAQDHVNQVDAQKPGRTLGQISESVIKSLSKERGLDLRSVEAGAQAALSADMFRPEDMLDRSVRTIGFAIATDKDEQGKPMLKMLFLAGR
jgi:uncharacterized protein YkwD